VESKGKKGEQLCLGTGWKRRARFSFGIEFSRLVPRDIACEVSRSQSVRAGMEGPSDESENISNELFEARLDLFHAGSGVFMENTVRLEPRL
jgi:hypothetical protein